MQIIFAGEPMPARVVKSVFLEGPSPRTHAVHDWKVDAVEQLQRMGYTGTVFIPIPRQKFNAPGSDEKSWTYDSQIAWEVLARQHADIILCYADRRIEPADPHLGMPGFTTNVEFGEDLASGKLVYGRPDGAEKVKYLDKRIQMLGEPVHVGLAASLQAVLDKLGEGAERREGETAVPLFIWRTPQFQSWYKNLLAAGNTLTHARLLHHVKVGAGVVFSYTLWVNVWVEAEKRHKHNEFIISRTDVSAVLAYHRNRASGDTRVVLVKEFRSPVNNAEGFVYELPGGSSFKPGVDPQVTARDELHEECGLRISDLSRFKPVCTRQVNATSSTHRATLYAIALSEDEMEQLQELADSGQAAGEDDSSERTYVVVAPLADLASLPVDFATLGMVYHGLAQL